MKPDVSAKYYSLWYRLHGEKRYLIWISPESGKGFVAADANRVIPSFRSLDSLRQYADLNRYRLETERPRLHDLDWVANWRKAPTARVNCDKVLAAWNLFGDIANSLRREGSSFKKLDSQASPIYDKVFWGNNLSAMTPKGKKYIPIWSPKEIASLAHLLTIGLKLFESRVRPWKPPS